MTVGQYNVKLTTIIIIIIFSYKAPFITQNVAQGALQETIIKTKTGVFAENDKQ